MICEDLARPDPAQEIVRAVGPNLVIALLMDGPQLEPRWPRRYASVLADDPGCSVLTLTSVGMIQLTEARHPRKSRDRIVGLWQDVTGKPVEIPLKDGSLAVRLRITRRARAEWTADGRGDDYASNYVVLEDKLGDVQQIPAAGRRLPPRKETAQPRPRKKGRR